ncbi:MAG: small-conductance mechanosensitive channel [Granulosicoccus sp.]|jgi:small-conductance mechanosensitive channel
MPAFVRLFFALGFLALQFALPAQAQMQMVTGSGAATSTAVELPDPLTPQAVQALVARMSDDQVRGLLLDQLDAKAQAQADAVQSVSMVTRLENTWVAFYMPIVSAIKGLPDLISKEGMAISNFANSFGNTGLLMLFGYIALAIAAGLVAEKAVNFMTRKWQRDEPSTDESSLFDVVRFLFRRFLLDILGLIAFFAAARTVARTMMDPQQIQFAGPFMTLLILFPRIGAALARFVLAPQRADLRLVSVSDKWARYLSRNVVGLMLLAGFTIFVVTFNAMNGLSATQTRIGFWLNGAVHLYVIIIAWTAREGLTSMMRGTDPDRTQFDEKIARAYPYFAIGVSAVLWVVVSIIIGYGKGGTLLSAPHYTTMLWLLLAPAIDTLIRGLVRHLAPPMLGEGAVALAAYQSTKRSYIRIGRVLAAGFVVLVVANAWNINLQSVAAAGVGSNFAGHLMQFILTVAIGYLALELVSLWVNRRLAKEQTTIGDASTEEAGGEGGAAGGSRLTTVLPLALISAKSAIVVIFSLLALGSLGIDTTPLLAGAGILGLAIGFGAQKLVSDVVSGVFFLIDDAFRVGEYVEVEGTMGTVEKISIRSMQLRHHRGLVHTIPYGEIPKLTNFSRDWVIMKLMFTVPFDTDPNKVKKIFKKIGAEMAADPLYKNDFLEPFKSQGVLNFDDVGIVMRGKFMAKPGTQFTIRKEIYNRVRSEFAANGIEFARREVRVAIPGLDHADHLSEDEKMEITAAATAAAAQQIDQAKTAAEEAAK